VFDGYVEAGGNFIDTADGYQFGQSESLLGDFIAGSRDELVLATKFVRGREDLVRSGTILDAGISNLPAWRISRAALLAELRGWLTGKYRSGEQGRLQAFGTQSPIVHAEQSAREDRTRAAAGSGYNSPLRSLPGCGRCAGPTTAHFHRRLRSCLPYGPSRRTSPRRRRRWGIRVRRPARGYLLRTRSS
jgi:hypothetical protein